jgi:hypothetical protein
MVYENRLDAERHVAVLLGFDTMSPHTWPHGVIREILDKAESAFLKSLQKDLQFFGPSLSASIKSEER